MQFEVLIARPGRRADVLEPGLQARDSPPGELRPRPPTPKGNTGQAHDIGFLRRQSQEPWPVAPDEQRRMGTLDGERLELMPPHVIVLSDKRDWCAREQLLDDPHGLCQALD